MIILDTNVISEPMKPKPDARVLYWLDKQLSKAFYLTTPSLAELLSGIELLPNGHRKTTISNMLYHFKDKLFGDRVLPFDVDAAQAYAMVQSTAKKNGRAIGDFDAQIAAIAYVQGFTVATRDTSPFEAVGIPVINPWDY
jgi:toxin FitB